MEAMAPFIVLGGIFLIIIIICLTIMHWPVNKTSLKVNNHGLSYKTQLFAKTSFNLGFYDDKSKSIIWLLHVGIDHDQFSYLVSNWRPKLSKNFFGLREIDNMINQFKSIEEVHEYNNRAKQRTINAQIEFDERLSNIQNRINKYS